MIMLTGTVKYKVRWLLIIFCLFSLKGVSQYSPKNPYTQNRPKSKSVKTYKYNRVTHDETVIVTNYLQSIKINATIGTGTYYGDLCDGFDCFVFRQQLAIGTSYKYSQHFSLNANIYYIRLYGNDANGNNYRRNLHFRSENLEMSLSVTYYPYDYEKKFISRALILPFIEFGIGTLNYNPRAEYNGYWRFLRPLKTEGVKYKHFTTVLLFGPGVTFKITPYIDVHFFTSYRITFTDYLDDVSTTHRDIDSFDDFIASELSDRYHEINEIPLVTDPQNPTRVASGLKRGNPNNNDGYFLLGMRFDYTLKTLKQVNRKY